MTMLFHDPRSWIGWACLALAACDPSAPLHRAAPLEPRLAGLYERACATCHDAAGSGAPLRGDRSAWAQRERAGTDALVASVRQGKGSMPPMGWCPECSDTDLAALLAHLRAPRAATP